MLSGIYQIRNVINDKVYIGSAIDINKRYYRHFNDLSNNRHHCIMLQRSYNKYSIDDFVFEILEVVDDNNYLQQIEKDWLDSCRVNGVELFNTYFDTKSPLGTKHTTETKNKMKANHVGMKGKSHSEDTKKMISESHIGMKFSDEHKEKLSQRKKKPVYQIDLNTGEIIKSWDSMLSASRTLRINHGNIASVCRGINIQAGGYKWRFINV